MSADAMDPSERGAAAPPGLARLDPAVEALQERLGVPVVNPDVALAALTHKSFVNEHRGEALQDNERLEFLGDAVLDLAVSQRLMERFPEAREGELSKIRAAVVDEAGLAVMARELDLGPLLRLGRGEELTGGRQKSSLLADAMEAVIAALYLGGGLDPALALIDRFLGAAFAQAAAGTLDRDFKTQLQELAQSRLRATPRYRVVAERGPDHSKVFEIELEVRGEVVGRGEGRSKKDAEQAAAKRGMEVLASRVASGADALPVAFPCPPDTPDMTVPPPAPEAPVREGAAITGDALAPPSDLETGAAEATQPPTAPPAKSPREPADAHPKGSPKVPGRRRRATPRKVKPAAEAPRRRTRAAASGGSARRKPNPTRARSRKPAKE